MQNLLDRFLPYIAPHPHFDIVISKHGPVYVYPVDRQGLLHDAEVLDGLKGIVEAVAFQMICDVTEPSQRVIPTEDEVHAVRSRIQSMLKGLESESECMELFEEYVSHFTTPAPS